MITNSNFLDDISTLSDSASIYIYGTGRTARVFVEYIEQHRPDIKVLGYVDTYKETDTENQIYNYTDFRALDGKYETVVVCSIYWDEISASLMDDNINHMMITGKMLHLVAGLGALGDFYFTPEEHKYYSDNLGQYTSLFEDSTILENLFKLRSKNDAEDVLEFLEYYKRFEFDRQYFDFYDWTKVNSMVEAGVNDGRDMIKALSYNKDMKIVGFEPNLYDYKKSDNFSVLSPNPNVTIEELALWDKKERIFAANEACEGSSFRVVRESDDAESVQATDLDSYLNENGINSLDFIKMDIEGAEMSALTGARETIKNLKPNLAICIYHKRDDIFNIPKFIKELNPDYKLHIGIYSSTFCEIVLYAINS